MSKNKKNLNFILNEWVANYPPAKGHEEFTIQLSTEEIKEEICRFVTAEIDEITEFLIKNKYHITKTREGEIKWLISSKIK